MTDVISTKRNQDNFVNEKDVIIDDLKRCLHEKLIELSITHEKNSDLENKIRVNFIFVYNFEFLLEN